MSVLDDHFQAININRFTLRKSDFSNPDRLKEVLQKLPPSALIVVIGGDGTNSLVVSTLLHNTKTIEQSVTVLPLKGGNASDIAHMLHGSAAANLTTILRDGVRKEAYALSLDQDGQPRRFVLAYVSFGASAQVMQYLDGLSRRHSLIKKHPWLLRPTEILISMFGLNAAKRFTATINGTDSKLYDILFVNGSQVAKYYKTHAKLTNIGYLQLKVPYKHPVLFWHLLRLGQHYRKKSTTTSAQTISFNKKTYGQIDGDAIDLPAGSKVTIAKEVLPYYVLATPR